MSIPVTRRVATLIAIALPVACASAAEPLAYPLVDTMQDACFDVAGASIECPARGEALYGQDAQYSTLASAYTDNGDGTVHDDNTGLLWQQAAGAERLQFADAASYCESLELGGRSDWRVPSIKELYSLADFRGELLKPEEGTPTPYLDAAVFDFDYPEAPMVFAGQYWSSTLYVKGPIINGRNEGAFGFNFADGHIKAYGTGLDFYTGEAAASSGLPTQDAPTDPSSGTDSSDADAAAAGGPPPADDAGGGAPGNFVRCVSGTPDAYGVNDFTDNGDGTVDDAATGRTWQRADDGERREWADALAYCEALQLGDHDDWRLPDSKELQSIVDYDKPDIPAIDEDVFGITRDGDTLDYWTGTTFGDIKSHANVIVFGKALSKSADQDEYIDWHGSGAQRSSIKTLEGQALSEEDTCSVNACDIDRPDNFVRCVR